MPPSLSLAERFDSLLSRRFPRIGPRLHRAAYQASGGRLGTSKRGIPVALLTTTGRHSGQPRTTPVMVLEDGARFLAVASNAGFDQPPAWLRNLEANPEATLQLGGSGRLVRGRVLDADERAGCWESLVAHNPLYADFQQRTAREVAVIALEPTGP
jgi:deazaflavin-dependent oxidoreductase (nitroreductase family)